MTTTVTTREVSPEEAVVALRRSGALDDSTSDGRFARLLGEARSAQVNDQVRWFAWQVCERNLGTLQRIGIAAHEVVPPPEPAGFSIPAVQRALGLDAPEPAPDGMPKFEIRTIAGDLIELLTRQVR